MRLKDKISNDRIVCNQDIAKKTVWEASLTDNVWKMKFEFPEAHTTHLQDKECDSMLKDVAAPRRLSECSSSWLEPKKR